MADIVINHRVGTSKGHGGMYNRYDGVPLPWDERAVTSCSGGLVTKFKLVYVFCWHVHTSTNLLKNLYFVICRVIEAREITSTVFQILITARILFEKIL